MFRSRPVFRRNKAVVNLPDGCALYHVAVLAATTPSAWHGGTSEHHLLHERVARSKLVRICETEQLSLLSETTRSKKPRCAARNCLLQVHLDAMRSVKTRSDYAVVP